MMEEISERLGEISLWGMVLLNVLYYYSMAFKLAPRQLRVKGPDFVKRPLKWKTKFRKYHYWGNPIVVGMAFVHGWYAEKSHWTLWLGWGILVLLSLSGFIMKLQKADQPGAKVNRLIHSQHFLSIAMLFALLIGHGIVD